jgi:membrane-bound lytic murein transglycosylase A
MRSWNGRAACFLFGLVLAAWVLAGCAAPIKKAEEEKAPPPESAEASLARTGKPGVSDLSDDLPAATLREAVDGSLAYYERRDADAPVWFGRDRYSAKDMRSMLQQFRSLLDKPLDGKAMKEAMRDRFVAYQGGGKAKEVNFTGYYEPILSGSRLPGIGYTAPIYRVPADLIKADLGLFQTSLRGIRIVGRYSEGNLVPYYTRHEIDRLGLLAGKGYEIAWLKDPVDVFFLHIQGSGKIVMPDRSVLHVHYAASNGRPYRGIGNLLVERGAVQGEEKSMWSIRQYLKSNPEEQAAIMDYNESYVFFETVPAGPLGSLGVKLTGGRSIAVDPACYPAGALAYIETEAPVIGKDGRPVSWEKLRRFVLVQDVGGAVRGPNRADIFWGDGDDAGMQAGWMNRKGKIIFFAPKTG